MTRVVAVAGELGAMQVGSRRFCQLLRWYPTLLVVKVRLYPIMPLPPLPQQWAARPRT